MDCVLLFGSNKPFDLRVTFKEEKVAHDLEEVITKIERIKDEIDLVRSTSEKRHTYYFYGDECDEKLLSDKSALESFEEKMTDLFMDIEVFHLKHQNHKKSISNSRAQLLAKFYLHAGIVYCKNYPQRYYSHNNQPNTVELCGHKGYDPTRGDSETFVVLTLANRFLTLGLLYQAYVFGLIPESPNLQDKENFFRLLKILGSPEWTQKMMTLDFPNLILITKGLRALCWFHLRHLCITDGPSRYGTLFFAPEINALQKFLYQCLLHQSQQASQDLNKINNQLRRLVFKDCDDWPFLRGAMRGIRQLRNQFVGKLEAPLDKLFARSLQMRPKMTPHPIVKGKLRPDLIQHAETRLRPRRMAVLEKCSKVEAKFKSLLTRFSEYIEQLNKRCLIVDRPRNDLDMRAIYFHNYFCGAIEEKDFTLNKKEAYALLNELNIFELAVKVYATTGVYTPYTSSSYGIRLKILELCPELRTYEVMHKLFGISPEYKLKLTYETAPAEHIARRNRAIVNQTLCARALSTRLQELYQRKVIIALRGTSGSRKTSTVREIVGPLVSGAFSEDPVKKQARNQRLRNHQVRHEITEVFKEYYPEVTARYNLSYILDSRLLELSDVKKLVNTSKTIQAVVHIYDHDVLWESSVNSILGRSVKGEDPVVDFEGVFSGFKRARAHRYSIVNLIKDDDTVEIYKLFYRGQLVAEKNLRAAIPFTIYDYPLYQRCFVVPTPPAEARMVNQEVDDRWYQEAVERQDLSGHDQYMRLRYWADKKVSVKEALTRHANGEE
jgi:hypothetical protein